MFIKAILATEFSVELWEAFIRISLKMLLCIIRLAFKQQSKCIRSKSTFEIIQFEALDSPNYNLAHIWDLNNYEIFIITLYVRICVKHYRFLLKLSHKSLVKLV